MQYGMFSDRQKLPPLPRKIDNEIPEINEIELEPHAYVNGKKNLFKFLGLTEDAMNMTSDQIEKLQQFYTLEKLNVFEQLQTDIVTADFRRSFTQDYEDDKDVKAPLCDGRTQERGNPGLILWLKGHSIEFLRSFVVPPIIPGKNDVMADKVN